MILQRPTGFAPMNNAMQPGPMHPQMPMNPGFGGQPQMGQPPPVGQPPAMPMGQPMMNANQGMQPGAPMNRTNMMIQQLRAR